MLLARRPCGPQPGVPGVGSVAASPAAPCGAARKAAGVSAAIPEPALRPIRRPDDARGSCPASLRSGPARVYRPNLRQQRLAATATACPLPHPACQAVWLAENSLAADPTARTTPGKSAPLLADRGRFPRGPSSVGGVHLAASASRSSELPASEDHHSTGHRPCGLAQITGARANQPVPCGSSQSGSPGPATAPCGNRYRQWRVLRRLGCVVARPEPCDSIQASHHPPHANPFLAVRTLRSRLRDLTAAALR